MFSLLPASVRKPQACTNSAENLSFVCKRAFLWRFLFSQSPRRILKHAPRRQRRSLTAFQSSHSTHTHKYIHPHTQTYSANTPESRPAGLALECVQSYNLIIINQYANQGAAFMSNPQQADTHTHTLAPQTTARLQGISSPACVTSKISTGARSH